MFVAPGYAFVSRTCSSSACAARSASLAVDKAAGSGFVAIGGESEGEGGGGGVSWRDVEMGL